MPPHPPRPTPRAVALAIGAAVLFVAMGIAIVVLAGIAVAYVFPTTTTGGAPATAALAAAGALLLVATRAALRQERARMRVLGLALQGRRVRELLVGLAIGAVGGLALAWALDLGDALSWRRNPVADGAHVARWVAWLAAAALVEELLFRGWALRQLGRAMGDTSAVLALAVASGLFHLAVPGMTPATAAVEAEGWELAWRAVAPTVAGLVFGLAAVRTRGLMLPIGLHVGGSLVQWQLLALRVKPEAAGTALPVPAADASPVIFQAGHLWLMLALAVAVLLLTRPAPATPRDAARPRPLTA